MADGSGSNSALKRIQPGELAKNVGKNLAGKIVQGIGAAGPIELSNLALGGIKAEEPELAALLNSPGLTFANFRKAPQNLRKMGATLVERLTPSPARSGSASPFFGLETPPPGGALSPGNGAAALSPGGAATSLPQFTAAPPDPGGGAAAPAGLMFRFGGNTTNPRPAVKAVQARRIAEFIQMAREGEELRKKLQRNLPPAPKRPRMGLPNNTGQLKGGSKRKTRKVRRRRTRRRRNT